MMTHTEMWNPYVRDFILAQGYEPVVQEIFSGRYKQTMFANVDLNLARDCMSVPFPEDGEIWKREKRE